MNRSSRLSVTRVNELQQQLALLANLRPTSGAIVSCHLNLGHGRPMLRAFIRSRLGAELARLPGEQRGAFKSCIDLIEAQLESDLPTRTRGLAIFAAADREPSLLSAMPFAVPFRNSLGISRSPDLMPLLQLEKLYGRFMILVAEPEDVRLAEVNLGDVAFKTWATTSAHTVADPVRYRDERQTTGAKGLVSQVSQIERRLGKGDSCPLFLVGRVDHTRAIRDLLGPPSLARLIGVLPMPADATLQKAAAECLRSLLDHEATQARSLAAQVLRGIRTQGHAAAGVVAVLDALRSGIADRLVISRDYRTESGRMFDDKRDQQSSLSLPELCRSDSKDNKNALNLRVELIRLAAKQRCKVEFTDSQALRYLGGVGCLLNDHPQMTAQPTPPRYGSLDLVA